MNPAYQTFVISLKMSPRREKIAANLASWGSYEIVDAVDGAEINSAPQAQKLAPIIGRTISQGEVGVLSSHLRVYEKLIASSYPYAVVFEDDAIPSKHARAEVQKAMSSIDLDILSLFSGGAIVDSQDYASKRKFLRCRFRMDHTVGYVISKACARAILQLNLNNPQGLADWPIGLRDFKVWVSRSPLVAHVGNDSTLEAARQHLQSQKVRLGRQLLNALKTTSRRPLTHFWNHHVMTDIASRGWFNLAVLAHDDHEALDL